MRPCHRITPDDEVEFARKLLRAGMCELIEEDRIYRHPTTGKMMIAGLFGVYHKPGKQRLIVDRRPVNSLEQNLSSTWMKLPHAAQLCEILLLPSEALRGSSDDLECWFYQLQHESHWAVRQAVGRRLEGAAFAEFGADPHKRYRLCIGVVAMGDHNGCAFAQSAHEELLNRHGLLRPPHVMRYGASAPHDPLWEGCYIDDHLFCQRLAISRVGCLAGCQCKACGRLGAPADVERVACLERCYESQHVSQSSGKRVRFQTEFEAWGAHVSGRQGKVAVHIDKRRQISRLCFAVARRQVQQKPRKSHSMAHIVMI